MSFSSLSKAISRQDWFGHSISFNFNKKGETHNTFIGGLVSILIKLIFAAFTVQKIGKMVDFQDKKIDF